MNELVDQAYNEYLNFFLGQRKSKYVILSNGIRLFFYVGLLINLKNYSQKNNITKDDIVLLCQKELLTKQKFSRVTGLINER